jgi:hypothetical protein
MPPGGWEHFRVEAPDNVLGRGVLVLAMGLVVYYFLPGIWAPLLLNHS